MFARTRIPGVVLAATVFLAAGCQTPDGSQGKGVSQQQQKRVAADEASAGVEVMPAKIEAATYLAAARLHESQGRLLPAIQQYQFASKEDPNNAEILGHMGVLYDRMGNGAAAEAAYQRALGIKPDDAALHNNLAFSYIMRKQWTKAEAELNRALAIAPEFARARMNLAMTQAQLDRYDEAFKSFSTILPPEDAHYNMGLMYQSRRKLVAAAEQYKRALKANPKLVAAEQQLKKLPAATLSEADRRLDAERKATELAAKTAGQERQVDVRAPAQAPLCAPIAQPASRPAEQATNVAAIKSAELTALLKSPSVFNLSPKDDSELPGLLDAGLAARLDGILPPWQRTPELIAELSTNSSFMSSTLDDQWLDWVESPLPPLEHPPIMTVRTAKPE